MPIPAIAARIAGSALARQAGKAAIGVAAQRLQKKFKKRTAPTAATTPTSATRPTEPVKKTKSRLATARDNLRSQGRSALSSYILGR